MIGLRPAPPPPRRSAAEREAEARAAALARWRGLIGDDLGLRYGDAPIRAPVETLFDHLSARRLEAGLVVARRAAVRIALALARLKEAEFIDAGGSYLVEIFQESGQLVAEDVSDLDLPGGDVGADSVGSAQPGAEGGVGRGEAQSEPGDGAADGDQEDGELVGARAVIAAGHDGVAGSRIPTSYRPARWRGVLPVDPACNELGLSFIIAHPEGEESEIVRLRLPVGDALTIAELIVHSSAVHLAAGPKDERSAVDPNLAGLSP